MTTEVKSRTPLWIRILLIVSLALNLGVASLAAGFFLRGPMPSATAPLAIDGFRPAYRAMTPEERRHLRAAAHDRRGELRSAGRELAALREEFLALLVSDDFSEAALRDLMTRQSRILGSLSENAQVVMAASISAMDTDQRRAFAERLRNEYKKFDRRGSRSDDHSRRD